MKTGANHLKTITLNRGIFNLKATIVGQGLPTIVIGSHLYYPRTFSKNLESHLQMIFMDTRTFVPENLDFQKSDFSIEKIIDDVEALRVELKLDKLIIIGHSIHAFMALEYAKKFPDKVSHLILIASSPITGQRLYHEADRYFEESVCPMRKAQFLKNMEVMPDSFIDRMLSFGPRLWFDYHFDASYLWQGVEMNSIGSEVIWGEMFANYPMKETLNSIQCPIFLALGRYDYFNPPHLWENYREYAKNLRIRVFEKSGHTPQLEENQDFDNEIITWINE